MARTFTIDQGTMGLLLKQDPHEDLEIENFAARTTHTYTDANVLVDPVKVQQFGNAVYESGSHAARLAKDGYVVFSSIENEQSAYMFAVHLDQVHISE
jgi:hypothetical protein